MNVDAWGKLWEKATAYGIRASATIRVDAEECGKATLVWSDGSLDELVFDNGDWTVVHQTPAVEKLGIDGQIHRLLVDIRDNYEPELIAYERAVDALALLDVKEHERDVKEHERNVKTSVDHPMSGAL